MREFAVSSASLSSLIWRRDEPSRNAPRLRQPQALDLFV